MLYSESYVHYYCEFFKSFLGKTKFQSLKHCRTYCHIFGFQTYMYPPKEIQSFKHCRTYCHIFCFQTYMYPPKEMTMSYEFFSFKDI